MPKIRLLLVDDNPEFLEAATRFVATAPQISVVGQALSGRDAVLQVSTLCPDLVLMDYVMPDMNGIEATREMKAQDEVPQVVILTLHDLPEYRAEAEAAGADGFLAKADFGRDLLPLIASLFAGSKQKRASGKLAHPQVNRETLAVDES
jgi:DNA-binding NarL/FixJ family response regulator